MNIFVASALALLTIVALVEGVALLALMRQVGTVLSHVAPPRPGVLEGGPTRGEQIPELLRDLLTAPVGGLLVFLSTNCPSCRSVEKVLDVVAEHYPELTLVPLVLGDLAVQREEYAERLSVRGRADFQDLAIEWSIPGTPYAVGVDAGGYVIHCGIVNSLDQLEALAETLVNPPPGDDDNATEEFGVAVPGFADVRS